MLFEYSLGDRGVAGGGIEKQQRMVCSRLALASVCSRVWVVLSGLRDVSWAGRNVVECLSQAHPPLLFLDPDLARDPARRAKRQNTC